MRHDSIDLMHPFVRSHFRDLLQLLETGWATDQTPTEFRLFETYRSPDDQQAIYQAKNGRTQASAWRSAHQWGWAADFVPWSDMGWSWAESHDWDFLDACASRAGLVRRFSWDRPHIEHPDWQYVRKRLRG